LYLLELEDRWDIASFNTCPAAGIVIPLLAQKASLANLVDGTNG
jgi:hypothetical protein